MNKSKADIVNNFHKRQELNRKITSACEQLDQEGYKVFPKDAWEIQGSILVSDCIDALEQEIKEGDFENENDLKELIVFLTGAVHGFDHIKPTAQMFLDGPREGEVAIDTDYENLAEELANSFLEYIPDASTMLPPKELVKGVARYVVMKELDDRELRQEATLNVAAEGVKVKIDYRNIPMYVEKLGIIDGFGADSYLDPYYFPYGGNLEASLEQSLRSTFEAWLRDEAMGRKH